MNEILRAGIKKKSMIINLDKTEITEKINETIIINLTEGKKLFRIIAFVGVNMRWRRKLVKLQKNGCTVKIFKDYEKSKEWVM